MSAKWRARTPGNASAALACTSSRALRRSRALPRPGPVQPDPRFQVRLLEALREGGEHGAPEVGGESLEGMRSRPGGKRLAASSSSAAARSSRSRSPAGSGPPVTGTAASWSLSQSHSPGSTIAEGSLPPRTPAGAGRRVGGEVEREAPRAAAAGAGARVDGREAALLASAELLAAARARRAALARMGCRVQVRLAR